MHPIQGLYVVFFFMLKTCFCEISISSNAYKGIVVAISSEVTYNPEIIPNIEEIVREGSAFLFQATRNRTFFRELTILIPPSWPADNNVQPATKESFNKADIRITTNEDSPPYVAFVPACGKPGTYMHLSAKFILNKPFATKYYGPRGKTFVHEWGHLRYGLFDEYTYEGEQALYDSTVTGKKEITRCNVFNNVKYLTKKYSNQACKSERKGQDCYFDFQQTSEAQASFMFAQFMPNIVSFCDNDQANKLTLHNLEAPNRQNNRCNHKSAWEVLREHPDFQGGINSPLPAGFSVPSINFTIVQRRQGSNCIVLVMDTSGSMSDNLNIQKLNRVVSEFLLYRVSDGACVGLVQFASSATLLTASLVNVTNQSVREELARLVPKMAVGGTAIGAGLIAARNLLVGRPGSRILLLSDGQETDSPTIAQVTRFLISAGLVVDAVMFTTAATNSLITLSKETGGNAWYASDNALSTSLSDAFSNAAQANAGDSLSSPVKISENILSLNNGIYNCTEVTVDDDLGRDTTFYARWISSVRVLMAINLPNGTSIILNGNRTWLIFRCDGECPTGTWNVCITTQSHPQDSAVLRTESSRRLRPIDEVSSVTNEPIMVESILRNEITNFSISSAPVEIYAIVRKGAYPVIGCSVFASIEGPGTTSDIVVIPLFDNGVGADAEKDDGVYSGYLLRANVIGKHTVKVQVTNGTNTQAKRTPAFGAPAVDGSQAGDLAYMDIGIFQRYASNGFITVLGLPSSYIDVLPPSHIQDLAVIGTSYEQKTITLEWSAVGDDFMEGNASKYELWSAETVLDMLQENGSFARVTAEKIIVGNLSQPKSPLSNERVVVRLDSITSTYVFGIIALDNSNLSSDMSNLVTVKLQIPEQPMASQSQRVTVSIVTKVVAYVVFFISGLNLIEF